MRNRMSDWITTGERPAPSPYITAFAKSATGGGRRNEPDDEDDDDPDDEDDEDDEDDPDEGKTDAELKAELKEARERLTKANAQGKKQRLARRAAEEAARKPKPKSKNDDGDDGPDLDAIREEGRREGNDRAKRSEARAALAEAGVSRERLARAVGLLKLDDLDLDDDGLDGIDDEIDRLRSEWPEMFGKKRRTRDSSLGGERDRGGESRDRTPLTVGQQQAAILTGKARARGR